MGRPPDIPVGLLGGVEDIFDSECRADSVPATKKIKEIKTSFIANN